MLSSRLNWRRTLFVATVVLALVCARQQRAAVESTGGTNPPTRDFPLVGGNYSNQRYSALSQINTSNVQRLGGAWSIHLEDGGKGFTSLDATPIVVDSMMYVSTGTRNVVAIDARTGNVKWRYRPESEGPS